MTEQYSPWYQRTPLGTWITIVMLAGGLVWSAATTLAAQDRLTDRLDHEKETRTLHDEMITQKQLQIAEILDRLCQEHNETQAKLNILIGQSQK